MPKTRHELGRDDKVEEIVAAAKRQVLDGGFPALSMAGIARELGVAQNAVYWYFPSRDHLFVAVLRQLMADVAASKSPAPHDPFEGAVRLVDRIADVHPLIVAMHERARVSEVVADFQQEVEVLVRGMVRGALESRVPDDTIDVAVESYIATVEGVLLRRVPRRQRADIVTYTLARLAGQPWSGSRKPPQRRAPKPAKRRAR